MSIECFLSSWQLWSYAISIIIDFVKLWEERDSEKRNTWAILLIAILCFIERSFAFIATVHCMLSDCLHPPMRAAATGYRAGLPVAPHTLAMNCEGLENKTANSSHHHLWLIIKGWHTNLDWNILPILMLNLATQIRITTSAYQNTWAALIVTGLLFYKFSYTVSAIIHSILGVRSRSWYMASAAGNTAGRPITPRPPDTINCKNKLSN